MIAIVKTEMVELAKLSPYPGNARAGDIELIQESVKVNGQYRAMCVNKRTNQVLGGNHLLHALLGEGLKKGLVNWVDVDEQQARKINLVLNRAHELGSYDLEALLALAMDGPLEGTGFTDYALEELIESSQSRNVTPDTAPGIADDDDDPDFPTLRWSRKKIPMTEDEFASVVRLYNAFRSQNQSDIGFGFHLLEGHGG